jgi:tetratricopeptide (TPR) repeat protein
MDSDDQIAASLPRPPLPAPARRQAAIDEALRQFDGLPPTTGSPDAFRQRPWWARVSRPYAGALASAALVAIIGLPVAWMLADRQSAVGEAERPVASSPGPAASVTADAGQLQARPQAEAPLETARTQSDVTLVAESTSDPQPPRSAPDTEVAQAAPPLTLLRPSPQASPNAEPEFESGHADYAASSRSEMAVAASRMRASATESRAAGSADESDVVVTGARRRSSAAARGDWNACTVDDPNRSPTDCRRIARASAKGGAAREAQHMADGISQAWRGDFSAAIEAFDRAIEIAPRSVSAHLNRGLAYKHLGDLDRALADFDLVVRYAPGRAIGYYHRSVTLRLRGDLRRARADEARAVDLDPRYAALLDAGR